VLAVVKTVFSPPKKSCTIVSQCGHRERQAAAIKKVSGERRKPMKIRIGFLMTVLLLSGAIAANAQQVTVTGCPAPGAIQGCIMIRGADNLTYNITNARKKPDIGKNAIRVTGYVVKRNSYCSQGTVLANVTWTNTNQPCN
jgi:hypothetical protein